MKWVAVAPFELKLGPSESYGRAASIETPPRAQAAQIRAKITVNLPPGGPSGGSLIMLGGTDKLFFGNDKLLLGSDH